MILLFVCLLIASFTRAVCYEPSPAFPLPKYDSQHSLLKNAFGAIESALKATIASSKYNITSFSVEVTSSEDSLWSLHHTARQRNASQHDVDKVDGDTLYRIASITKTFTVLGILYQHAAGNLSLDDPIDIYIEELKEKQKGTLPWKDITLRSLASQLSGIPREFVQSDVINAIPSPWQYGFPPLPRDGLPNCNDYANDHPSCGKEDLLDSIKSKLPVFAPNQISTYSNVAFELLGLVIEKVTGESYASYISRAIFEPLSMGRSSISKPPASHGVIPIGEHSWDMEEGIESPTGGIYSSSSDMSKYLRYILTHYNGITHATNWFHPGSPGGGMKSFYGMPWEIYRTDRILPDSKRPVNFITKGGGLPGYMSNIILLPEYNLGITILVAGSNSLLEKIREVVTVELVRAAEKLATEQLRKRYEGTYISPDLDLNSSVTLVADHRGLVVTSFISNGTDVLAFGFPKLGILPTDKPWYAQLAPTLLYKDPKNQSGELWRLLPVAEPGDSEGIWDDLCHSNYDLPTYAGLPINEFVLWGEEGHQTDYLELTAFKVKLQRDDRSKDGSSEAQTPFEVYELK
ncbi:beta-lactamase/transpeptidase-like protein [Delitschia confertaspora ATCC 74209]|uniref:Beta-lactamase/transpeptidase-like protein n=1 Tax=Delitschia confertaspora ATCC 74209 TaxID=1513339 RepID=A0A9P4MRH5_9PLEO|nr:beta-lactamase/transpeptidase-like protein [Delitschia confertaspora ATCC 74209]